MEYIIERDGVRYSEAKAGKDYDRADSGKVSRRCKKKELGLPMPKVSGTEYIPPMKLIKRRKYFQNSITYKCTVSRGIEVNNDLASLVGIYVEIVNS